MGSIIEAFPQTPDARRSRRSENAWRGTSVPGTGALEVRAARLEDYAVIRALQRQAHPAVPAWTLKQLESQRHAFPEGQMVAECDGEVVGAAASLVVRWDDYALEHTWKSVTGDGFFTTHDTAGRTLYGAEVVVNLARRGYGIGRSLVRAQKRLCRKLNLRRIISAARLPGYHEMRSEMSPELYAKRVIWGDIADPILRFQMSQGFQFCGIIKDYLPEDVESCGNAALIVWLNPFYSPTGPSANVERPRKCA